MSKKTALELVFSGDEFYKKAIEAIDSAQAEVIVETYIFSLDLLGERILGQLEMAARRGVLIRVLVDGIGSISDLEKIKQRCLSAGIKLRVFNPPRPYFVSILAQPWVRAYWRRLSLVNKRNHRKLILVDKRVAFLGSMNITQVHLQEFMGEKYWRDNGVILSGFSIEALSRSFDAVWHAVGESFRVGRLFMKHPFKFGDEVVNVNISTGLRRLANREIERKLQQAQERIWITTPYFVPNRNVLKTIISKAKAGKDVVLLLPGQSDVFVSKLTAWFLYRALLKKNIRIFEYQKSILHAKSIIVDQWGLLGSRNLNSRSFLHDLEIDIQLSELQNVNQLALQFSLDLMSSREIKITETDLWSPLRKGMCAIAFRLRYWF